MFDFATVYNHDEQFVDGVANSRHNATILVFPHKARGIAATVSGGDVIGQRMKAPLGFNEMTAVLDMVKDRAKRLGQELWIVTGIFLAMMGVEELGDLCRCDFVRAIEYLVRLEPTLDPSAQMQSAI